MKKMLVILTVLLITAPAFSSTLKLKSGTTLEVMVLEQHEDSVTVKTDFGTIKTLPFEQIESINGETSFLPPVTQPVSMKDHISIKHQQFLETFMTEKKPADQNEQQIENLINYHSYVQKILQDVERDFNKVDVGDITAEIDGLDQEHGLEFQAKLSDNRNKLNQATPPAGLEQYHKIILHHLQFMETAHKELASDNFKKSDYYLNLAKRAYLDALKELRNALVAYDAPRNDLEKMNFIIEKLEDALRPLAHQMKVSASSPELTLPTAK